MLALTYQVFAAWCGWLEAILYARRGAESFSTNEHVGMMYQRIAALLLAPVAVLEYHWLGWWVFLEVLPMALLFPMCHDEAYNFTRLWLKWAAFVEETTSTAFYKARLEYRYGYQSDSTTARNDFRGSTRTIFAITAAVLLVALYAAYFLHFFPSTHG